METKKEIMETLAKNLNKSYLTIREFSKKMGYTEPDYLAKKVKKLKLGYRVKGVHLLSQRDQEILRNSIQRKDSKEESYISIYKEEDKTVKQMEELLVKDLNENYCTVNKLAIKEGYNDNSTYLSRKAKRLGLGIRIKTTTLLSKEDQETLIKSIKRRKREDL